MGDFMREYWKSYVFPVGMPALVFFVSFFGTNIGLAAFPIGFAVCVVMAVLTTMKLRRREREIDQLINKIRAAGK